MRAKTVKIPTYDELYDSAPVIIKDYLDRCVETPQSSRWHPEGCVDIHQRLVYDRAAETGDINLAVAALFHDLGKVDTTAKNKRGDWAAHGHEQISSKLVYRYKDWIESLGADPDQVFQIVSNHMRIHRYDEMRPTKQEQLRKNPFFNKIRKFGEFDDMSNLSDDEINRYK